MKCLSCHGEPHEGGTGLFRGTAIIPRSGHGHKSGDKGFAARHFQQDTVSQPVGAVMIAARPHGCSRMRLVTSQPLSRGMPTSIRITLGRNFSAAASASRLRRHLVEWKLVGRVMVAAEFQAKVIDGRIEIPQDLRDQFSGDVNVILFADGAQQDESAWSEQNRRRWELIARKVRQGLSRAETEELAILQRRADEKLAGVGPRPVQELESRYTQLSQED